MASLRYVLKGILLSKHSVKHLINGGRHMSQAMEYGQDRDPAPLFFNPEMQDLLHNITRTDLNKVFAKRKLGGKGIELPSYKFMSEDQLQKYKTKMLKKTEEMLQIPPVVKIRSPVDHVLCKDDALSGIDKSKFVFTDITFGVKNTQRLIVIRETDGTLREADWETKDRMNQIYFPIERRKLNNPQMFEDAYLKNLLNEGEYLFVLDKACLQYEPDTEEYQRVTSLTYQHINEKNAFEALRSTRHFGAMTFFLSWFKMVDNLLLELIETMHIEEALTLLKIYSKMHKVKISLDDPVLAIEKFIKEHSLKKGPLEIALQAFKEKLKEQQELDEGIKVAHGLK